jgi:hypothetical protein
MSALGATRSGTYTKKTADGKTTFYRDYGGKARANGRFWIAGQGSSGPLQSQMDSAVLPEWENTLRTRRS